MRLPKSESGPKLCSKKMEKARTGDGLAGVEHAAAAFTVNKGMYIVTVAGQRE